MFFLDPRKPIATCVSESCEGCPVPPGVHCHFTATDLIYFLLVVFVLSSAAFFLTLKMFLCTRCMNFACPLNAVGERARRAFLDRNPALAEAWGSAPARNTK